MVGKMMQEFVYGKQYELSNTSFETFIAIYIGFCDDNTHLFFRANNDKFEFYRTFRANIIDNIHESRIETYKDDNILLSEEEKNYLLNRMKHWEKLTV